MKHDEGGVGEVESGFYFGEGWRAWLMLGHRLGGPKGIFATYDERIEIGVNRTF